MRIKDFLAEIFVFLFSLVIRLPSLGWDIFNPDSWCWRARSYQFSTGIFSLDFAQTAPVPHPGVTLMWVSTLAIKVYHLINRLFRPGVDIESKGEVFVFHFAMKLSLVLVTSLLLALSFRLLRRLVGLWPAFFSVLVLTLEPYFLAHTRIYHLDTLLSMFSFVAVLFLLNFLVEGGDRKYLILSTVFSALAMLTKSTGLFLIPFVGLILLIRFVSRGISLKRSIRTFTCYLLLVTCCFFLFWPAVWVRPFETLRLYFSGISGEGFGGHGQVVFGEATTNPGPIFYPLSLWIRLSPWLLIFSLGGVAFFLRELYNKKRKADFFLPLISLFFILTYLIFLDIPTKKLERYTLPIYPFLTVLAALSLSRLVEFTEKWVPKIRYLAVGVLAIIFILSVYRLHPDYLAYYSPLAGGLGGGIQIICPDWAIGAARVGRYFNSLPNKDELRILTPETGQFRPFLPGYVSDSQEGGNLAEFDYLVLPCWSERNAGIDSEPQEVVEINGVPIYNIYRVGETSK